MKRIINLILIITSLFIFEHCDNSLENNETNNVIIDKNVAADMLGNNDGNTSEEEVTKVDNFYNKSDIGFAVGSGYSNFGNSIPADTIKKYFHIYAPLCKNETELREAYKGISIKTPYVGIFVMKLNKGIIVINLYKAPGPNIYGGTWEEIKIL